MAHAARRAVFLDRDGVLNEAIVRDGLPYPPKSVADVRITDGAADALSRLKAAGFLLLVVTNQPDIARAQTSAEEVDSINRYVAKQLPLDNFFICPHDGKDGCDCRKPKPGLLLQGARQYQVDLSSSYMVGDRWRDVEAGHAAGCTTVWIDYGYQERAPEHAPAKSVSSLLEAVDWILANKEWSSEQFRWIED